MKYISENTLKKSHTLDFILFYYNIHVEMTKFGALFQIYWIMVKHISYWKLKSLQNLFFAHKNVSDTAASADHSTCGSTLENRHVSIKLSSFHSVHIKLS